MIFSVKRLHSVKGVLTCHLQSKPPKPCGHPEIVIAIMSFFGSKVSHIQSVLNKYYPNPPVPLNNCNNFTFLVAVILSAQSTDGKVNAATKELFKRASTPQIMAQMDVNDIESIIKPVGLAPTKALHISKLSKILIEKFDGAVPCTYSDLESLPGVGHKTASVVMSQIFGEPAFPVDTHVHRLALRWGLSKEVKSPTKVQQDLCGLFPREHWNKVRFVLCYNFVF